MNYAEIREHRKIGLCEALEYYLWSFRDNGKLSEEQLNDAKRIVYILSVFGQEVSAFIESVREELYLD